MHAVEEREVLQRRGNTRCRAPSVNNSRVVMAPARILASTWEVDEA